MERIHATCVAVDGHGVLLRGPSGAGKSDLALRLIDGGAALVADDYTEIRRENDRIQATAPAEIAGLLEVRGLGVLGRFAVRSVAVAVVIDLVDPELVPRMAQSATAPLLGVDIPLFRLAAFEASAPAKVRLAVNLAKNRIISLQ